MNDLPRRRHWLLTLVTSAMVVAAFVWPRADTGSICTFKRLAGVPCPGCGMTRSVLSIVDGRWGEAARFHPFGFLAVGLTIGLWIYGSASFFKPSPPILSLIGIKTAVAMGVVLAAYLALWVVRLVNGSAA